MFTVKKAAIKAVISPLVPIKPLRNPPSAAGSDERIKNPIIAASMVDIKLICLVLSILLFTISVKDLAVVPATKKPRIPIE